MLKIGDLAPNFVLKNDCNESMSIKEFKGQKVILYFYPKDDTPGCTTEACDFRDNLKALNKLQTQVLGISKDTVASHAKFRDKYQLNFPLLADIDGKVCETYGVIKEKSMFGKKYMGISRTTFLIDEIGHIQKIWNNVKVTGHIDDIVKNLS